MDQKLYKETFDEITMPQKLRKHLADLPERSIHMKHTAFKKPVLVLAVLLVLCLGCTCYAALRAVRTDTAVAPDSLTHDYDSLSDVQKETGLKFHCPETLDSGFVFGAVNINEDTDYDENGEAAGSYKSVYISYLRDREDIIYQISPIEEASSQTALETAKALAVDMDTCTNQSGKTITFYYQEERMDAEDGTPSEMESVIWSDGTNFYSLSGYNLNFSSSEWFAMAKNML